MTFFAPAKSHAGRKRLKCGHWVKLSRGTWCDECYNASPRGQARNKVYNATAKGLLRNSRRYYKRRKQGFTAAEAKYVVVMGNEKETQRRLAQRRKYYAKASQRFRNRWGNIKTNPTVRYRWEQIREGLWDEKEHPL